MEDDIIINKFFKYKLKLYLYVFNICVSKDCFDMLVSR